MSEQAETMARKVIEHLYAVHSVFGNLDPHSNLFQEILHKRLVKMIDDELNPPPDLREGAD